MKDYIVHFDAIAALLTGINLYIFYNQKKVRDTAGSRFEVLLWLTLASSLFSAGSSLAINQAEPFSVAIRLGVTWIFYLIHNTLPFGIARYVAALTGKQPVRKRDRIVFSLPYLVSLVVILTNPLTGFVFRYDPDLGYRHGNGLLTLYLLASIYFIWVIYVFLRRYRTLPTLTRVIMPMVLTLTAAAIVVENVFGRYGLLLECFAAAVSMLLVLYTIQNSDELVDGATGLFNKAAFLKTARSRLENGADFEVLFISLRNMPLMRQVFDIQDLLRVFKSMALFLSRLVGKTGTTFIVENDSFAVILDASADDPKKLRITNELRKRFDLPWIVGETEAVISMQLCLLRCPEDAKGVMEIFDCLERLSGLDIQEGQQAVLNPASLNLVGSKREAEAERALRVAMETGRIDLLFQPIYSVAEGRYVFAEALLTLQTEEGIPVEQRDLLRVAERNGLAQRLGLMIIDTVCAFYSSRALHEAGIEHIQIRLSGAQCMQSDLPQQALAVIEAWRFDPRHICFEITETAAVHSPDIMTSNMKLMSEHSLEFALDDYGSGYTDLGYIVELPFSLVKLDKSIVRAGFRSDKGRIILHSTIELIKRLNRKIVAEGVETADQAEILAAFGCDYLQGYYFARPVPGKEFSTEMKVP